MGWEDTPALDWTVDDVRWIILLVFLNINVEVRFLNFTLKLNFSGKSSNLLPSLKQYLVFNEYFFNMFFFVKFYRIVRKVLMISSYFTQHCVFWEQKVSFLMFWLIFCHRPSQMAICGRKPGYTSDIQKICLAKPNLTWCGKKLWNRNISCFA